MGFFELLVALLRGLAAGFELGTLGGVCGLELGNFVSLLGGFGHALLLGCFEVCGQLVGLCFGRGGLLLAGLELLHQVGHFGCLRLAGNQFIQCLFMGFFELLVALLRGFAAGLHGLPVLLVLLIQLEFLGCKRSGQPGGFLV